MEQKEQQPALPVTVVPEADFRVPHVQKEQHAGGHEESDPALQDQGKDAGDDQDGGKVGSS